MSDGRTNAEVK